MALLLGWFQVRVPAWFPLLAGGIGILVGAVWGLRRGATARAAARWVDRHGELSDRVLTALEFMQSADPTATQRLQLADAMSRLQGVDFVPRVVPPDWWRGGFALLFLAAMTSLAVTQDPTIPATVARQSAEQLATTWATVDSDPRLESLAAQVKELSAEWTPTRDRQTELERQGQLESALTSQREALETLGESQQGWSDLAQVLRGHWATRAAGEALKENDFQGASSEFAEIPWEVLSPSERRSLARQLNRLSRRGETGSPGTQAIDELRTALASNDANAWAAASQAMVDALDEQASAQQAVAWLNEQLGELHAMRQTYLRGQTGSLASGGSARTEPAFDEVSFTSPEALRGEPAAGASDARRRVAVPQQPSIKRTATQNPKPMTVAPMTVAVEDDPIPLGYRTCVMRYFQAETRSSVEPQAVN